MSATQINLFEMMYDDYKISKDSKIHLIELFGGYGSQRMGLKRVLDRDCDKSTLVEWAVKSIQAYKDVHCTDDDTNYSASLSDSEVFEYLCKCGISMDYNKPMNEAEIKRKGIEWQRQVYNNIKATNDLVDISRVKGSDLEISNDEITIMTYSFPCQDLSL